MPWTMHVIAATSFFVFALTAQALTTIKCRSLYHSLPDEIKSQFMHLYSLYSKIGVVGASITILLVNLVVGILKIKGPYTNICEWTGTLLILIYNASFCNDWYGAVNTTVALKHAETRDEDQDQEVQPVPQINQLSQQQMQRMYQQQQQQQYLQQQQQQAYALNLNNVPQYNIV